MNKCVFILKIYARPRWVKPVLVNRDIVLSRYIGRHARLRYFLAKIESEFGQNWLFSENAYGALLLGHPVYPFLHKINVFLLNA